MFQKLGAVVLLLLMGVVVATSRPGLRYCLCFDELFVGCCELCGPVEISPEVAECSDCGCCHEEVEEAEAKPVKAVGNCFIELHLELGKFINSDRPAVSDEKPGTGDGLAPLMVESIVSAPGRAVDRKERAPPPPMEGVVSVPVFLRHSVFLI